jgi:hypothetical protein
MESSPMRAIYPDHLTLLDLIIAIIFEITQPSWANLSLVLGIICSSMDIQI